MIRKKVTALLILFLPALPVRAASEEAALVSVPVDFSKPAQTIDNIGASGCWFSESIGKYWPAEKKERIARLLFSRRFDAQNNPEGIGLSAWRFNIGAGSAEQGERGGIKKAVKRTECFLGDDGSYDWNKQEGYRYFLQKAHDYGVERLIAFSNSPPVRFTKNGLGYKTDKDYETNLRPDAFDDYARFLAEVLKHFDAQGIHFDYVSPVNEPQWDWSHKYGEGAQEGSPWKNGDIFRVVRSLDAALEKTRSTSRILITEAGMLTYLYGGNTESSRQIQRFFNAGGPSYAGDLKHMPPIIGGHSYFTETDDRTLASVRRKLAETAERSKVGFWQTEYSMLGDGYREGTKEKRTTMDCALFLAKVIHSDLTLANAEAWQFWNAYEPGNADFDTRYYLIALNPRPDFKDGEFTVTKNLWALGHYSLFVRPGMRRLATENDDLQGVMTSAYRDGNGRLVVVAINYGTHAVRLKLDLKNPSKQYARVTTYLTTAAKDTNLKPMPPTTVSDTVPMPARSIATLVLE